MTRVLVPTDGSGQFHNALECAFDLFPDGELIVLHVLQVKEFPKDRRTTPLELAQERANEVVEEAKAVGNERDRTVETDVIRGHVANSIVDYVDRRNAITS